MTRQIDSHVHLWRLERGDYGWLTPELAPIYRDFAPPDLEPLLTRHGIDGVVLVQAAASVAETEFLLSVAAETPWVEGVVGWVEFSDPRAPETIAHLAEHRYFKGLRPMIQDIPDIDWMLRANLDPAFRALIELDLAFDALVMPWHLENLRTLLARYPDMRTVICHGAKPQIRDGAFDGWAAVMAAIARETAALCKLSGLVTEAAVGSTVDDFKPYVDHLIDAFGPARLLWGSDWPVCTLAVGYGDWRLAAETLTGGLGADQRAAVFGGNAIDFYRLIA